jgi:hypothetical protein
MLKYFREKIYSMVNKLERNEYPDLKQWIPAFGPYFAIWNLGNKKPSAMNFNNYPILSGIYAAYQIITTPLVCGIIVNTLEEMVK